MGLFSYFFTGILVGLLGGIGLFAFYLTYQVKKTVDKYGDDFSKRRASMKKEASRANKDAADKKINEAIGIKLDEASEIIKAQSQIAAELSMPSKNALHSKYKNKLSSDWHVLEDKKHQIFASILASGVDPTISVYDDTIKDVKEMKLSELVAIMSATNTDPKNAVEEEKRMKERFGDDVVVKKITKNGKTFHLIKSKNNKTEH